MMLRRTLAGLIAVCFLVFPLAAQAQKVGPFTKPTRSVRNREFDQQHLALELAFDWEKEEIVALAMLRLKPYAAQNTLTLDAAELQIKRVYITLGEPQTGERDLSFDSKKHKLTIELDRTYKSGEEFEIKIEYLIRRPRHGAHFVNPDHDEPNQPRMVWTQSEPEYARYWYPCLDSPADRFTSEIRATVPQEYFVLSNGVLKSMEEGDDGTATWHWSQVKSHVPYLVSLVAGEFDAHEQSWDDIPIVSYVPKGMSETAARSFEKTPAMMRFFSEKTGYRYPWPKYAQICVDEYNWGGMEHTSATTLTRRTLHDERAHLDVSSDGLVAHELAHQWFGDLLTCKDWGELWLNESFATYFANLWTEHDKDWDEALWQRHLEEESYKREDRDRYRRAIVNYRYDRPANMFDRHSYPKGGRVLHMLRFQLGDDGFWKSINRYLTVNQYRTVETADLRIAIEDATGQGLGWFFDQWVYHGGHPEFKVSWKWDEQSKTASVSVEQMQKATSLTPTFRTPVEIELALPNATLLRRVEIASRKETFVFELEQKPTRVCFDPRDWILKKLDFPKSKEELLDQLADDSYVMCRVRAIADLAKLTSDADAREALIRAARNDSFWAVRGQAAKALEKFQHSESRDALIDVAHNDAKSSVRREAIKALAKFEHEETNAALRRIIERDQSYFAIADALRSLVKTDRKNCAADLTAALTAPSHHDEILKAAIDGLANLRAVEAAETLTAMLEATKSSRRRVLLTGGIARLKGGEDDTLELLHKQLESRRSQVRSAAVSAIGKLADPRSIAVLQKQLEKEEGSRARRTIEETIDKIRQQGESVAKVRKQLDEVQRKNRLLEKRLEKLEAAVKSSQPAQSSKEKPSKNDAEPAASP